MEGKFAGALRQSSSVVARQIADQWLLIPIHGTGADLQKVYLLNDTSAAIWRLLEQPMSFEQVVTALQAEYAAPEEVIQADTRELLHDLVQRGFLTTEVGNE